MQRASCKPSIRSRNDRFSAEIWTYWADRVFSSHLRRSGRDISPPRSEQCFSSGSNCACNRVASIKANRVFKLLGAISYSLYLIHVPIAGRVVNLRERLSPGFPLRIAIALIAVGSAIVAAYVLYILVERPAQRWASRCLSRHDERPVIHQPWPRLYFRVVLEGRKARALVAQRIEHLTSDQKVGGSSPSGRICNSMTLHGLRREEFFASGKQWPFVGPFP